MLNVFFYLFNSLNETLKKYWKMGKNAGKVREICQSENVGTNLILCGFNETKVNFQCIELLFIEHFLMTRYRHIGILGKSEGDHSTITNLKF